MLRKVDELGRLVLPLEIRRQLGIKQRDSMDVKIKNKSIILKPAKNHCRLCGSVNDLQRKGKITICSSCLKELSK